MLVDLTYTYNMVIQDILYYFFISFSLYWDYAVTIYLDEIVYLHCHQQRMYCFIIFALNIDFNFICLHFNTISCFCQYVGILNRNISAFRLLPHSVVNYLGTSLWILSIFWDNQNFRSTFSWQDVLFLIIYIISYVAHRVSSKIEKEIYDMIHRFIEKVKIPLL